ncbi:MAG: hypothetical protein JOS17DRAFT_716004, partial [Linnemannia elongata]
MDTGIFFFLLFFISLPLPLSYFVPFSQLSFRCILTPSKGSPSPYTSFNSYK